MKTLISINSPGIVLLIIVAIAAVIGIITYVIYKLTHPKLKEEENTEEQNVKEELDRMLQPVDDDETAEQIKNYKSPEDTDEE